MLAIGLVNPTRIRIHDQLIIPRILGKLPLIDNILKTAMTISAVV